MPAVNSATPLAERRIDHPPDRHDRAHRRVRHRAEQLGGRNRRHGERAAYPADHRDHPDHDPARDAALRHDLAGQHEERHREQRQVVEPAEQIGLHGFCRHVGDEQHRDQAGHQQHEEDRQPENEQHGWQDEVDGDRCHGRAINVPNCRMADGHRRSEGARPSRSP
jgi:hypothetical protein